MRSNTRESLEQLGRRLPEHAADLRAIADSIEREQPHAILRARTVATRAMRALCDEEELEVGNDIQAMLDALLAKHVIPPSIAASVELLHDPEATLVGDSVQALIGFLEWRIGSRRKGVVGRVERKKSRRLPIALGVAIAVVGVVVVVVLAMRGDGDAPSPLTGGVMVRIPGATFDMGSSPDELAQACAVCRVEDHRDCVHDRDRLVQEQLRPVTVSAFEIDRTEVTTAAFVAWLRRVDRRGAWTNVRFAAGAYTVVPGAEQLPIAGVTWHDARAHCEAVGRRLPTEAEWELAARGTSRRTYPWGNAPPQCAQVVFARQEPLRCALSRQADAAPVASAPGDVTPEGVHDLGGNVAEWTSDAGGDRPICNGPCVDPRVTAHSMRVVRGGHWSGFAMWTRAANRSSADPEAVQTTLGFRCARSVP